MPLSLRVKRRHLRNKVQWQGAPRVKLPLSALVHFSCRARLRRGPPGSLRVLQHSLRVRTVSRNLPKCVNIIFWTAPFSFKSAGNRLAGNRVSDQKLKRARLLICAARKHRENWRGETAWSEYRWARLLTPPVHRSVVRLVGAKEEDAAAKDPAANPVLCLDAYFLGSASFAFCSVEGSGCLPSVLLENARRSNSTK